MELLKQIFIAMNKHFPPPGPAREQANENTTNGDNKGEKVDVYTGDAILSIPLRKHVTETMLYMLKTFVFCSISHQQAIMIMTSLKDSYDQEDLAILKAFIRVELDAQKYFDFPNSTNRTSGMNMGQII